MSVAQCPEVDKRLCKLADKLVQCSEDKRFGCNECPIIPRCCKLWSGISGTASMHHIQPQEVESFLIRFSNLQKKGLDK